MALKLWDKIMRRLIITIFSLITLPTFGQTSLDMCLFGIHESPISKQLGWIQTGENRCGGYYLEPPFLYPNNILNTNSIQITSNQLLFAKHGTSIGEGRVTITRYGQQMIANRAYLYRDPNTGKLSSIELIDNVTLREPNSLLVAKKGSYNLQTKAKLLQDILYRTAIYSDTPYHPPTPNLKELEQPHKVYQLSAWGEAKQFSQLKPKIFEFDNVSYTTCPPTTCVWKLEASHLELNKETGRGCAKNARVTIRNVPVFYSPYLDFPIDKRRQSGFLSPSVGQSNELGFFINAPYYFNLAPNYDDTLTPSYFAKRGVEISNLFRYLTRTSLGNTRFSVLPHDKEFENFKQREIGLFQNSIDPATQAKLNRLESSSNIRKSFSWQNTTRFNPHWTTDIDFNYVGDDYYLRDLTTNISELTQNQLLQLFQVNYKGEYWNLIGRIQGYQTLHPVDEKVRYANQYIRLPQVQLIGDYPNCADGFDYFVMNDLSHFDIRKNPGEEKMLPIGTRLHMQPGIGRPMNWPFLTLLPRLQFAATKYTLGNITDHFPSTPDRTLPIFDFNATFYLDRNMNFLNKHLRQTLEPVLYYVYIPYRPQQDIPIFDTTLNTLNYDQMFVYNRFSGLDRIGDTNQISVGATSRFIDQETGAEKIRAGLAQIFYFKKRKVTLCNNAIDPFCTADTLPNNENDRVSKSPLAGVLTYTLNPNWSATGNFIWNPSINKLENQSISIQYLPDIQKVLNLGYNFVRNGDRLPGEKKDSAASNLSSTDISFAWPFSRDWSGIGRWTENWNHHHFQNVLFGLQYDSCCWAVRFVASKVFTHLNQNNTPEYDSQFSLQFALKGLGTVPVHGGDPGQLLTTNIAGYKNTFGRDF